MICCNYCWMMTNLSLSDQLRQPLTGNDGKISRVQAVFTDDTTVANEKSIFTRANMLLDSRLRQQIAKSSRSTPTRIAKWKLK